MDEDKGVRVYSDSGQTFMEGYEICFNCDREYHYILPPILLAILPDLCAECCDYGAMAQIMVITWER